MKKAAMTKLKRLVACLPVFGMRFAITAYALPAISPNVKPSDFNDLSAANIAGTILGIAMWVIRLFGVAVLIFGIYSEVTCRKDGDADWINAGFLKIASGLIMTCFPTVLKAFGVLI